MHEIGRGSTRIACVGASVARFLLFDPWRKMDLSLA